MVESIAVLFPVRDLLEAANERRGELSYEQMMALQHATWAASTNRGGIKTDPEVFVSLFSKLMENDKLAENPDMLLKCWRGFSLINGDRS